MKELRIALLGLGAVGHGFLSVLSTHAGDFRSAGVEPVLVAAGDSRGLWLNESGLDPAKVLELKQAGGLPAERSGVEALWEKGTCDLLVEVTPTNIKDGGAGLAHIKHALESGVHVVTSNKGPIALRFRELSGLARENDVELLFEATVGAAVPLLNLSRGPLRGNPIRRIRGILNGTSNYILSRMRKEQLPYDHVLREAIEMGIAETDPSADVEGWDAVAKVCILANSLMGWDCTPPDVEVTGITDVTLDAIQLAWDAGFGVRLVGEIAVDGDGRRLTVRPRLVPRGHPLLVEGTLNAVVFSTELAGDITVIGRGAGIMETASALLSDSLVVADRVASGDKS